MNLKMLEMLARSALGGTQGGGRNPAAGRMQQGGGQDMLGGLFSVLMGGGNASRRRSGTMNAAMTGAAATMAMNFLQQWMRGGSATQGGMPPGQTQRDPYASSQTSQASFPQGGGYAAPSAPQQQGGAGGWGAFSGSSQAQQETQASEGMLVLLEAVIFAAKADGHIDESEKEHIYKTLEALFPGENAGPILQELLSRPVDPASLATKVHSYEEACDLYRLSCSVIVVDTQQERAYLDSLAQALRIAPQQQAALEQEVANMTAVS